MNADTIEQRPGVTAIRFGVSRRLSRSYSAPRKIWINTKSGSATVAVA